MSGDTFYVYICIYVQLFLFLVIRGGVLSGVVVFVFIIISFYCYVKTPHDSAIIVLDCDIVVSEFELQFCYYVHFQINTL